MDFGMLQNHPETRESLAFLSLFFLFGIVDSFSWLQEEGIFRISGSASRIIELKNEINQIGLANASSTCPDLEKEDIHVVTGLFKLWLREV
jgi:hypothetical protein